MCINQSNLYLETEGTNINWEYMKGLQENTKVPIIHGKALNSYLQYILKKVPKINK